MQKDSAPALEQTLHSKSWKARAECYGSILQDLKSNKMDLDTCSKYIVTMVSDSNPQVSS